jgi:CheY-like chemotaxis protein
VRVLFVDDNSMNRKVVECMLEAAGLDMAEAEDAPTGLSMIEAGDYDLILMDLRMPGMDGLTAIRQIRARTDDKARLPIIVVTADCAPEIRSQALAAGADDVLHKPVEMEALFDAIAQAITKGDRPAALLA